MKEIREIVRLYDRLKSQQVPAALAVVVDVEQSSYRRIGARLLVAADGRFVGGISGGCLEGDALKRAARAIATGKPAVHTYDTTDGEDAVIGAGLGCEGRIDVLFIPLRYTDPGNEIEILRKLLDTREAKVLIRLLSVRDGVDWSDFDRPFLPARIAPLATHTGNSEAELTQQAGQIKSEGRSRTKRFTDDEGHTGRLLFEVLQPTIHLVLTGANYDIPAALRAARLLGWRTTVIGPRRKLSKEIVDLTDARFDYSEVAEVTVDAATALVLMSHDYDWDRKMVQHFLPLSPPYFGMLGPRKRMVKMDASLPDSELARYPNLYAPVGLDIGAETPEEIAASLIAEIVMAFRGRTGGALRAREGSIHP